MRSSCTSKALNALWSLRARIALCASRTSRAGVAFDTLQARRSRRTRRAIFTLNTLKTLRALRPNRASCTGKPRVTLDPLGASRSSGSGIPLQTLDALRASWPRIPLCTLDSLITLDTLRAYRADLALHSLRTLWACCYRRDQRAATELQALADSEKHGQNRWPIEAEEAACARRRDCNSSAQRARIQSIPLIDENVIRCAQGDHGQQ